MPAKHESQIKRLNRIEGQVRGIRKMVEEGRYCIDVANQVKAVRSALKQVALSVLDTHLRTCVATAIRSRKKGEIDVKIGEVMGLVQSWDG
ncbi:MAG: metal-sensitive transcriptional regulator [Elusimicrobiota bacterium]